MRRLITRMLCAGGLAGLLLILPRGAAAQSEGDPAEGVNRLTQWGIMDGNRVRTLYSNFGEIARWPDQPSGEWPKGSGHSYVDGVALIVSAKTKDAQGKVIYPMSTNFREFTDRDPVTKVPWGWAPLPGYSNPQSDVPARSDDPTTWPSEWPQRPVDWAGQWNGYFGKGVKNADLESYFVFDDSPDREWTQEPHKFYPCPGDTSRGGLGLEVTARSFQWNHPLAQDVIFWHYEITNECEVDYDDIFFAQYIDWGVGGTDDSGDDEGAYDTQLDLAYAWDFDGIGTPDQWGPVGAAGYAFLESPGNALDGTDNDEDGITDEQRDNGPGELIEGQDAIEAYVTSNYNVDDFERFYGPLDRQNAYQAGRWWTGDENMNWRSFLDANENGEWDPGEPLNDDVGRDGLGPNASNYPGRDRGEGDGQPTDGEPNFDELDKDESDQIGLTGFSVFDVHRYELLDDDEDYRIFSRALPPLDDIVLAGGRNLGMFFSSGPFPLKAGQTERFSMALLFANKDFNDPTDLTNSALARKKKTVQQIYNANYQFARPPSKPSLKAIPGDEQVTLVWDDQAEDSYDPFLQEYDFEGYMIYRSTEPNFQENLLITDAFGNDIYQKPLAQFDLNDDISGLHPVAVNGQQFYLGANTGLRHTYVDKSVRNGETYYYALVAYDKGLFPSGAEKSDQGISPSITSAVIKNDVAGNVTTDINTAMVTPSAPGAGYVPPDVESYERETVGTGDVDVSIVSPNALEEGARYEMQFQNPSVWGTSSVPHFSLRNTKTKEVMVEDSLTGRRREITTGQGFVVTLESPSGVSVVDSTVQLTSAEATTYRPVVEPATASQVVSEDRFVPKPANYAMHLTDAVADTSLQLAFGQSEIPAPFYIENTLTGERQDFLIVEDVDSLRNQRYDPGDLVLLVSGAEPGAKPMQAGGQWTGNWAIRLVPPDPDAEADTPVIPPAAGSVLRFKTTKPFQSGDRLTFSFSAPTFDQKEAKSDLDDVYVVPNPYVASSTFEPPNTYRTGRGERRLYFMGLPPECTIRIYTVAGELVNTIHRDKAIDDGQEAWDLTTRDGMNVAYGVYIYHIDTPDLGETIGRFAVIK